MTIHGFRSLSALFFLILFCGGCGNQQTDNTEGSSYAPGQTIVLTPSADREITVGGDPLTLDLSHTDQGYFMGVLTEKDTLVNIQVIGPDNVTYKYFLDTPDTYTAFPLTAGAGTYIILAYENISGNQYASLFQHTFEAELENEFLPFLYPNQYVSYTADSEAVSLAASLSSDAPTDLDALNAIYAYVTEHITYDNEKAETVEDMYLPDIDETLRTGTGICFDYASLTSAMLRALSIPAKLEIGYSGAVRHAWISVYIQTIGWVERAVEFSGDEWQLLDPTLASGVASSKDVREYTGDASNYTLLYVR